MAEMTSYEPGVPCWIDLGTADIDTTAAFYSGLFGWSVEAVPDEPDGYRIARLDGKAVAGLGPSTGGPVFWATYFSVTDADEAAARIAGHAATVLVPVTDAMDTGRFAVFEDPTGAAFSIWQALDFAGAELVYVTGTWCWSELHTKHVQAAIDFYEPALGWTAKVGTDGAFDGYVEWTVGGRSIAGGAASDDTGWEVTFAVDDVDASVALARSLGATAGEPMEIEGLGRFASITGPHGEVFGIIRFDEPAK